MALIYEKKIFRNLQEQVEKNKQDIVDLQQTEMALNAYGIKVVGQVETALDIPEDFEGDYGDAYLVGDEAPYDVYVWTRPNSETPEDHFVNIGPIAIVGPMGPQGPQGIQGVKGDDGIGWITGTNQSSTNYPAGTLMFNGLSGDIYKLVNGAWVNIGNIKGPQGVQGQQGPQGETGATGAQGPQGPKGDTGSSYQIIGTYAATANLPDPTLVNPGSAALVGADAPYELYIVVGATQDAQQWVDAGVFNDQIDGTLVIDLGYNSTGTLSEEIFEKIRTSATPVYLKVSGWIYRQATASSSINIFYFIGFNPGAGFQRQYLSINPATRKYSTSDYDVILGSAKKTDVVANKSSNLYVPTTKAVYDFVNPIGSRTPKLTATMTITGLIDPDGAVSIQVYAASDTNANWIALCNGFLNTNYTTISQVCTYLQTTLNAIGAAPSTNHDTIMQLIYIFAGMQMFSGNAIAIYSANNNPTVYSRFLLNLIELEHNEISINSTNALANYPDNVGLDLWLNGFVWGDDTPSLTDSDNLSFTITVH